MTRETSQGPKFSKFNIPRQIQRLVGSLKFVKSSTEAYSWHDYSNKLHVFGRQTEDQNKGTQE